MTRNDPSLTGAIRRAFTKEIKFRFRSLLAAVWQLVVEEDAFGLEKAPTRVSNNQLVSNVGERQVWKFETSDRKVDSFRQWLKGQVDSGILSTEGFKGEPWLAKYVTSAYKKGKVNAYISAKKGEKAPKGVSWLGGEQAEFLRSSFNQPEALSKVRLLATRSFEELKGVTSTQAGQINRVLSEGLVRGENPRTIARELAKQIEVSKERALRIARTEVIHAQAEGQLDSFEALGVDEVGIYAEWSTAEDDEVCPMCAKLEGAIMTVKEAHGLIPRHPNCRCTWIPADEAEARAKRSGSLQKKLSESLEAGGGKKKSTWAGKKLKPTGKKGSVEKEPVKEKTPTKKKEPVKKTKTSSEDKEKRAEERKQEKEEEKRVVKEQRRLKAEEKEQKKEEEKKQAEIEQRTQETEERKRKTDEEEVKQVLEAERERREREEKWKRAEEEAKRAQEQAEIERKRREEEAERKRVEEVERLREEQQRKQEEIHRKQEDQKRRLEEEQKNTKQSWSGEVLPGMADGSKIVRAVTAQDIRAHPSFAGQTRAMALRDGTILMRQDSLDQAKAVLSNSLPSLPPSLLELEAWTKEQRLCVESMDSLGTLYHESLHQTVPVDKLSEAQAFREAKGFFYRKEWGRTLEEGLVESTMESSWETFARRKGVTEETISRLKSQTSMGGTRGSVGVYRRETKSVECLCKSLDISPSEALTSSRKDVARLMYRGRLPPLEQEAEAIRTIAVKYAKKHGVSFESAVKEIQMGLTEKRTKW